VHLGLLSSTASASVYEERGGLDLQSQRATFRIIDPAFLKASLLQIFYKFGMRARIAAPVAAKCFPICE
jgi:hypothetical protein